MGLEEKCGGKKGSGDPGVERLTQQGRGKDWRIPRSKWAARACSHAAAAPDTGTLAAQGKEVRGRDVANETGFEEMGP